MTATNQSPLGRAIAIAQRDKLNPIPCVRRDTSEALWLVPSRSQAGTYYILTKMEGHIQCQCPAAQRVQVCAHAAAVYLLLKQVHRVAPTTPTRTTSHPPSARRAEERQRREDTLRRERALL